METETEKYVVKYDRQRQPTWIIPVVDPNGTLKFVRFNKWIGGGIVDVSQRIDGNGNAVAHPERALDVRVRGNLEPQGWALLADLFLADNNERAWRVFRDWMIESFVKERDVPVFPRERLPKGVQLRAQRKAPHQAEYRFDFGDDEPARAEKRAASRPAETRQEAAKA